MMHSLTAGDDGFKRPPQPGTGEKSAGDLLLQALDHSLPPPALIIIILLLDFLLFFLLLIPHFQDTFSLNTTSSLPLSITGRVSEPNQPSGLCYETSGV